MVQNPVEFPPEKEDPHSFTIAFYLSNPADDKWTFCTLLWFLPKFCVSLWKYSQTRNWLLIFNETRILYVALHYLLSSSLTHNNELFVAFTVFLYVLFVRKTFMFGMKVEYQATKLNHRRSALERRLNSHSMNSS